MSFLMVSGQIFICTECSKKVRVEYEGGAILTQVGDAFAEDYKKKRLRRLIWEAAKKLFFITTPVNAEHGEYLEAYGLCEKCYLANVSSGDRLKIQRITQLVDELSVEREKVMKVIEAELPEVLASISLGLTKEDVESAIGHSFDSTLGDIHSTPRKKKGRFNAFYQKEKNLLEKYLLRKAWMDSCIQRRVSNYREIACGQLAELQDLVADPPQMYCAEKTNQTQNLNDYLMTETTVRTPEENSRSEEYYFLVDSNFDALLELFALNAQALDRTSAIDVATQTARLRLEEMCGV